MPDTPSDPDPYLPMADLYDFAYGDYSEDSDFYLNLARATGGPILELGSGTGRVACHLRNVIGTTPTEGEKGGEPPFLIRVRVRPRS